MKSILIAIVLTFIFAAQPATGSWFNNREQQQKLEQQLQRQQQTTGDWQIIAFILGVGCVGTLVAGTIIGSKVRKHAKKIIPKTKS